MEETLPSFMTYTSPKREVARQVGLTPRTVQFYTDQGIIVPLDNKQGRGKTRGYSFRNVRELKIVRRLREAGVPLASIHRIMRLIDKWDWFTVSRLVDGDKGLTPVQHRKLVVYNFLGNPRVEWKRSSTPIRKTAYTILIIQF